MKTVFVMQIIQLDQYGFFLVLTDLDLTILVFLILSRFYIYDKIETLCNHCRQRAPVGNALSSSGTSQIGMFDIQATTKSKYYDHIVLLYLNPEDVVIGRLFLLVFTYILL